MPELPVLPDANEPNRTSESAVKSNSITCVGGCENHGTLSALFYTSIVLILGGLVALAAFPEIAEYATPWIGEPVNQHVCPTVNRRATGSNPCGFLNCSSFESNSGLPCQFQA